MGVFSNTVYISSTWYRRRSYARVTVTLRQRTRPLHVSLYFLPRDAMQARPMSSCGVCLFVCVSVMFVDSVKTNKHIFQHFSQSGSHTILVFPYQTAWQYYDGTPPLPTNGGVECRWGRRKSRFWANIWFHCVLLTLLPARCCQYDAVGPPCRKLWHFSGSKRRSLLMAGKDGEMFMTINFNVMPKTTEQHLIYLNL